jgi:hypothetical protein
MERVENKFAVLEGQEWTKETCGSCDHCYTSGENKVICDRDRDNDFLEVNHSACKQWKHELA